MLRLLIENILDRKEKIMAVLGDYISIKHGYAFKGDFISTDNNGIVLVTPGNFAIGGGFKENKCKYFTSDYPQEYVLKPYDLIVTMTDLSKDGDTLGFSALVPNTPRVYLHNQRIGLVQIKSDEITKDYLYWFMRTRKYQKQIVATASGSTVKHTSPSRICEIELELPSLDEQKRIVAVLNKIEEKININVNINNNLEQQAQAIYQRMFIDNASSDWEEGTLSDIADITMGQSPSGSSYNEDGNGTIFFQGRAEFGFRFPTVRLYTTEPKRMACTNDTLMSVRAPVGDLNVAHTDCCIGRGLAAIHSKNNHQSFVLYTMFSLKKQLDVFNGEGTVFGSINRISLNDMPLIIPSSDKLDEFEALVAPMDAAIRNNYDEICRLEQLRDSLLPKLMSGELDVSDIEL